MELATCAAAPSSAAREAPMSAARTTVPTTARLSSRTCHNINVTHSSVGNDVKMMMSFLKGESILYFVHTQ